MQSFSTKLLHKAILDKLSSWVKYINREDPSQLYSIRTEAGPLKIIISQEVITKINGKILDQAAYDGVWSFPILTLTFEDQCIVFGNPICARFEYADPELYKKLFAIVDQAAKHGLNDALQAIALAMEGLDG